MEIHSGLFDLVVISHCRSTMLNSQREVVAIFSGKIPMVLRIDGEFFHYHSLEGWAQKARFIVFHYHAFTLYNALLVDAQSIAMDAVKECQVWSDSVQGIAFRDFPFSCLGTMILAHSLFWEAIVLLRQYVSWTQEDSERIQFLIGFFQSRAEYAPSTFRHKAIFLEGNCRLFGHVLISS